MSQAVADLRQSTIRSAESEASVYQSALRERMEEEEGVPLTSSSLHERQRTRSTTPTGVYRKAPEEVLLLSCGTEDVVLRIRTTRPQLPLKSFEDAPTRPNSESAPKTTRPRPERSSTSFKASWLPESYVELSFGTIAMLILPSQAATIVSSLQNLVRSSSQESAFAETPNAPDATQTRVEAKVRLKALYISLIYDMRASDDPALTLAASQYWIKPSTTYVPFGQLKLRLEGLEGTYSPKGSLPMPVSSRANKGSSIPPTIRRASNTTRPGPRPSIAQLNLADAAVFEYLASDSAIPPANYGDITPGDVFPVLIFDCNLPKQYDIAPGAHSVSSFTESPSTAPASTFPDYDSVDWRNSGMQRRSGGVEKAWKVRQKGQGVLKRTNNAVMEDEGPVITARKELSQYASEHSATILPVQTSG